MAIDQTSIRTQPNTMATLAQEESTNLDWMGDQSKADETAFLRGEQNLQVPDEIDFMNDGQHRQLSIAVGSEAEDETDGLPTVDVNAYQHKKTLAQGMMDLALLSANANQLRYVLETYNRHPYFYPSLIFILISIGFQVAVGVGLILNSRYDIHNRKEVCRANTVNNYTVIGIFVVTVVNVFISAFGVADAPADSGK